MVWKSKWILTTIQEDLLNFFEGGNERSKSLQDPVEHSKASTITNRREQTVNITKEHMGKISTGYNISKSLNAN